MLCKSLANTAHKASSSTYRWRLKGVSHPRTLRTHSARSLSAHSPLISLHRRQPLRIPLDSFESRSSADSRGPCTDSPTHPSLKQTYNPSWVQGERVPVSDRTANEATTQRSVPAGGVLRDGQRLFSHRPKHAIALLPALYVREHCECDAADGDGRRDDKTERTALLPWLAPGRPSFAAIRAVPRSVTVAAERVNDTTT